MVDGRSLRGLAALLLAAGLLAASAGCSRPAALYGMRRIAVLALDDYTETPGLGAEVKQAILARVPRSFTLEVVDGAAIEAELPAGQVESALGDPARAAELGRKHGVDGFVVGAVTQFREGRDGALGLAWSSAEGLNASFEERITVSVAFNVRLVRAADGVSLIYRQAAAAAEKVLAFGLGHPYVSFEVSVGPHYPPLRAKAVGEAVDKLVRDLARAERKRDSAGPAEQTGACSICQ
ncbi:MAG: hypothetical protein ACM3XS_08030 [Bacteroidota bacterium]